MPKEMGVTVEATPMPISTVTRACSRTAPPRWVSDSSVGLGWSDGLQQRARPSLLTLIIAFMVVRRLATSSYMSELTAQMARADHSKGVARKRPSLEPSAAAITRLGLLLGPKNGATCAG